MFRSRLILSTAIVFLAGLAILAWGAARDGIGAAYTDPILKLRALDELLYANSALSMLRDGDWLTPKSYGRLFLQKPPLLLWLSVIPMKLFGISLFTVRLPSLLFGAAGVAAVFVWCAKYRSMWSGALAATMLLACPIYLTMSRVADTNITSAGFICLAVTTVALDLKIEHRRTWICAGLFAGAAIMTKSVAGVLPIVAVGAYWAVSSAKLRPPFLRVMGIASVAALVIAPWHIYQLMVHPKWFGAEYVQWQLLGIGVGLHPDPDPLFNQSAIFYARRLWQLNAGFTILAAIGIMGTIWALRSRHKMPELLAVCWTGVTILALIAFKAKDLFYITLLLPAACVLVGLVIPRKLVPLAALLLVFRTPFVSTPLNGAQEMRAYYDLNRDTELIAVETNDSFYSGVIPLPHVRYAWVDPTHSISTFKPWYAPLGIVLTIQQFLDLPRLQSMYERRLHEWGENSSEPIGSAIMLDAGSDVGSIIRAHSDDDLYLPASWTEIISAAQPTHTVLPFAFASDHVFLLSRTATLQKEPLKLLPAKW